MKKKLTNTFDLQTRNEGKRLKQIRTSSRSKLSTLHDRTFEKAYYFIEL